MPPSRMSFPSRVEIAALYARLERLQPSPVVSLNRAVAVAMVDGPAAALAIVDALAGGGALESYHLLHAARADFARRTWALADAERSSSWWVTTARGASSSAACASCARSRSNSSSESASGGCFNPTSTGSSPLRATFRYRLGLGDADDRVAHEATARVDVEGCRPEQIDAARLMRKWDGRHAQVRPMA